MRLKSSGLLAFSAFTIAAVVRLRGSARHRDAAHRKSSRRPARPPSSWRRVTSPDARPIHQDEVDRRDAGGPAGHHRAAGRRGLSGRHQMRSSATATIRAGGECSSRSRPSPGNHEYRTDQAGPYYEYFGSLAGSQRQGLLHLQARHLADLLAEQRAQHPRADDLARRRISPPTPRSAYSPTGTSRSTPAAAVPTTPAVRPLFDALYKAGAEVVLNGHQHNYERFAPQDADSNFMARGHARVRDGDRRRPARGLHHRGEEQQAALRRGAGRAPDVARAPANTAGSFSPCPARRRPTPGIGQLHLAPRLTKRPTSLCSPWPPPGRRPGPARRGRSPRRRR